MIRANGPVQVAPAEPEAVNGTFPAMSKFRLYEREQTILLSPSDSILVIEDSLALGTMLRQRIEEETAARILWCRSYAEAVTLLEAEVVTLAVTGLNLPDAPNGEVLDLLARHDTPTILFTATFVSNLREHYETSHLVDYFIKDGADCIDQVVDSIIRTVENRSISILVVDDMSSSRALLENFLHRQNYTAVQARSGQEALDILARDKNIRLVLTDYHMPDMDGHELTRRIRALHAPEKLRIIGISSSSDRLLSASFLKAGASDFVYSPFVPEELQCRITNNLDTLKQLDNLRFMAERDYLSRLYNRRAFFSLAQKALDRLEKDEKAMAAVAILDIDHFKDVNDHYGHNIGDEVIQYVSGLLNDYSESEHFLTARLGGEEFGFLFENRDEDGVLKLCETLRKAIEAGKIDHEGKPLQVTVSIGVARVYHGEPLDNHLNAADQMLYMAKQNGRNRVHSDFIYA